jgi:signal peptidase I
MIWLGVLLVVAAVTIALWVLRRRFLVVTVQGISMSPTYRDGDRVLVRRMRGQRACAGQVVVADLPPLVGSQAGDLPMDVKVAPVGGPELVAAGDGRLGLSPSRVVKRVAAVAGDRTPAGVDGAGAVDIQPVVPAGELVLLGDNPSASSDSRHYGFVPTGAVIGIVLRHLR